MICEKEGPCPYCYKAVFYARLHPVFGAEGELYCPTCRRRFDQGEEVEEGEADAAPE